MNQNLSAPPFVSVLGIGEGTFENKKKNSSKYVYGRRVFVSTDHITQTDFNSLMSLILISKFDASQRLRTTNPLRCSAHCWAVGSLGTRSILGRHIWTAQMSISRRFRF